jgi:hypothetical protein
MALLIRQQRRRNRLALREATAQFPFSGPT